MRFLSSPSQNCCSQAWDRTCLCGPSFPRFNKLHARNINRKHFTPADTPRRRRIASPAAAKPNDAVPSSSTPALQVDYEDTWSDIAFIALCRIAYGNIAGWQSPRVWTDGTETFKGMVEVSAAMMRGRNASQQRDAVIAGFPRIPDIFRRIFPYSKWGAETNAWLTLSFFKWLVGPMKIIEIQVGERPGDDGVVNQRSGVQIERCRYLAESNCTAMCVNLCKVPCQTFFTRELGMPLYMEPNFEDFSCKMHFGRVPPPLEEDAVSKQSCLAECATGRIGNKCHKLGDSLA